MDRLGSAAVVAFVWGGGDLPETDERHPSKWRQITGVLRERTPQSVSVGADTVADDVREIYAAGMTSKRWKLAAHDAKAARRDSAHSAVAAGLCFTRGCSPVPWALGCRSLLLLATLQMRRAGAGAGTDDAAVPRRRRVIPRSVDRCGRNAGHHPELAARRPTAPWQIVVIRTPDRLTTKAANAFFRVVEPPPSTVF